MWLWVISGKVSGIWYNSEATVKVSIELPITIRRHHDITDTVDSNVQLNKVSTHNTARLCTPKFS